MNCPPLQSEKDSSLCLCLAAISLLSLEQFSNSIPSLLFKTPWVLCAQDSESRGEEVVFPALQEFRDQLSLKQKEEAGDSKPVC